MPPRSGPVDRLFETAGNPAPDGIRCGIARTADRLHLRYAISLPGNGAPARGTVVIAQGRSETIEKYFETIGDLTRRGFAVVAFDWRGQGGSQRLVSDAAKGHVRRFELYAEDLETILRDVALPECPGPYSVLAHSMGGTAAILASRRLVGRVERIVAAAPMVALFGARPRTNQFFLLSNALRWTGFGRMNLRDARRAAARFTLENNPLTGDPVRFARNRAIAREAPQLFTGRTTAGWLAAATGAMRRLEDSDAIARLGVPTLIVTAGADAVVSSAAAERLAWRMRCGHALTLPGARHELLQEQDRFREPFLAAFEAFVSGGPPSAAAAGKAAA